jgi:glycosyltransferase involved in cell wall biosynthesis
LKILFLTHEYPPYIFGGIGNFVRNYALNLTKSGIETTVVCGYPSSRFLSSCKRSNDQGINVIRLNYPNLPPHHFFFQFTNLREFQETVVAEKPDVIHGQSGSSFPAINSLQSVAPFVVTFHDSPLKEKIWGARSVLNGGGLKDLRTYLIGYPLESYIYGHEFRLSDLAIAVSESLKMDLLAEMGQQYSEKTHFIHNGIDVEQLEKDYSKASLIAEDQKTILFSGRLFWRKGALNVVKLAFALQKRKADFKILVHGNGPLYNKMQKEIASLGLSNIHLLGFTPRAKLLESLRQCKFIALPSYYDACPMSLLEGMCLGKIPLLLNMPFAQEISNNGRYGIIASDADTLAEELIKVSGTADLDTLGNDIKSFSRSTYNAQNTTEAYLKLYKEVS